ncbi:hypothetical protein LTR37_013813 [Vermiconidia calcicola]|uniref:Uncharacterized protein n=1 Tax=Vermiconidia calcicola TaxID=1690605 RepID=A0ACC3MX37_9PEZI|nr:hypothetical protein LTR37_013813 [Vermiconidia calcicola]
MTGQAKDAVDDSRRLALQQHPDTRVRSSDGPQVTAESMTKCILALPTELQVWILSTISFRDLCAFRLVSKGTSQLLSAGEVVKQWALCHFSKRQLDLYPPDLQPAFDYVSAQQRRYHTAAELATRLAEYIERDILRFTLKRYDVFPAQSRGDLRRVVKEGLVDNMIAIIFTIQHYLEQCSEAVMTALASDTGSHYSNRFYTHERLIVERYDTENLLLAYKFWLFVTWLQAHPVTRRWRFQCIDKADYRLFVLFGNVKGLSQLLKFNTYEDRRSALALWVRNMDPIMDPEWQQTWQRHWHKFGEHPTEEQAVAAMQRMNLLQGDLLIHSARAKLIREGVIPHKEAQDPIGTSWQTIDFLCEIAGYDVLHTPPSMIGNWELTHIDGPRE